MGIKGRRKKLREREARLQNEEESVNNAGIVVMGDGPFQCPTNALGELRIKKSELYKLNDEEYLHHIREEHRSRRQSHLGGGAKKRFKTDEELENEVRAVEGGLLDHHFDTVDADVVHLLSGAEEGTDRVKSRPVVAVRGPSFGHPVMDLRSELVGALSGCGWTRMTRIQERCIPYALQGYDILGQARTGSGKTLAFCVPVMQTALPIVERMKPNAPHPTLALLLAPTKELCVQTEQILQRIIEGLSQVRTTTSSSSSSAGPSELPRARLITGGTKAAEERRWLENGVTIVVGTPGRVHDHCRHCKGWVLSSLRFLVLDEADRMLADGFQRDLDGILSHLPRASRQTFLFSATNSKSVQALARLSLHKTPIFIATTGDAPVPVDMRDEEEQEDPMSQLPSALPPYMSFNEPEESSSERSEMDSIDGDGNKKNKEEEEANIPSTLQQFCHIVPLEHRLLALYVFVKRVAKKSKAMVFCSTVASATFHYQMLGSIGFHNEVMMLHGQMKHRQRVQAFQIFNEWETGVLMCTDVAARGLDIPHVEWILQYDPPLDPTEYIHRIGRTARAGRIGRSLLFLSPQEIGFVRYLKKFGISLEKYPMPDSLPPLQHKLEQVLQLDPIVAKSGVSAFRAHVGAYQSHILQETFDVHQLDLTKLAKAFALSSAPSVSLPNRASSAKHQEYVKGKLKSLNKRRKESLRHYEEMKTKVQWDGGVFVGVSKPL